MDPSLQWHKLTSEVEAILLSDIGREGKPVRLPPGTIFRIEAGAGPVSGHPGEGPFYAIALKGGRYRVKAAAVDGNCAPMK